MIPLFAIALMAFVAVIVLKVQARKRKVKTVEHAKRPATHHYAPSTLWDKKKLDK